MAGSEWLAGGYARFLKRQLSLPVSMMSQWCVSRSSMAVAETADEPNQIEFVGDLIRYIENSTNGEKLKQTG